MAKRGLNKGESDIATPFSTLSPFSTLLLNMHNEDSLTKESYPKENPIKEKIAKENDMPLLDSLSSCSPHPHTPAKDPGALTNTKSQSAKRQLSTSTSITTSASKRAHADNSSIKMQTVMVLRDFYTKLKAASNSNANLNKNAYSAKRSLLNDLSANETNCASLNSNNYNNNSINLDDISPTVSASLDSQDAPHLEPASIEWARIQALVHSPPWVTINNNSNRKPSAMKKKKDSLGNPKPFVLLKDGDFPPLPPPMKTPLFKSNFAQQLCREKVMNSNSSKNNNSIGNSNGNNNNHANGSSATRNNNNSAKLGAGTPRVRWKEAPSNSNSKSTPSFRAKTTPMPIPRRTFSRSSSTSASVSSQLTQCHRCQAFGHFKNDCRRKFVCMKCAGLHPTVACRKHRNTPPKCCNCGGQHISAYKGCPFYSNLKRKALGYSNDRQLKASHQQSRRHSDRNNLANLQLKSRKYPVHQQSHKHQQRQNANYWQLLQDNTPSISNRRSWNTESRPRKNLNYRQNYRQDWRNTNRRTTRKQSAPSYPISRPANKNPAEAHLARFQAKLLAERARESGEPNASDKPLHLALQPVNETNATSAMNINTRGPQHKASPTANNNCCHLQHLTQSLDELKAQQDKTHERLDKFERLFNKLFKSLNKIIATLDLTGLSLNLHLESDQSDQSLPGDLFDTTVGESYMEISLANDSRSA
ncbi:homeobox protein 2-like isoform X1 [Drosophila ananassae]|uniref:homeobox protein 2-like isoform X1 n=2 Tax=Drosophila ananassae TaxID=7217 RepID=UPI001CFFA036|nr:homeobox protein 2-like isoform X1 [Drosophila ananassae]XP_044573057.1 homeobox protein 2-like isoform X1 [Drosophila ananassae]